MRSFKRFSSPDFYDRQWEQHQFQRLLSEGQNILVTAPRRVGKTELARKLLDWATDQEWLAAYANVEHAQTEADFFDELVRALSEAGIRPGIGDQLRNAGTRLRKLLPASAKVSDGEQSFELAFNSDIEDALREAQERMNQLLESLTGEGQVILIGLDELPIFLSTLAGLPGGEARVASMLNWFRKLRTTPALSPRVRWLLCGSIGLDTFVEQRRMAGSINDLRPQKLGPFEHPIAIEFVKLRAASGTDAFDITDDLAEEVVNQVGWPLPYYLRLMVDELKALPPIKRSKFFPCSTDVKAAYAALVSPDKKIQFVHWVGRLDLQFGKVVALTAHAILKQCCQKPEGTTKTRLRTMLIKRSPYGDPEAIERELVDLLSVLERDGYLHGEDNRWAFRSFLLRDFWLRHVAF
jgi:uncharacterized protein